MLILLYSDTNYVLDGFNSEFSITDCLNNCSSNGLCSNQSCLCTGDWIGEDCSIKACDCGMEESRGLCEANHCVCRDGFSGQSCSLRENNPEPSQWHWISNSSLSFTKRAAHTAIYEKSSDSVYVFGGYDLNNVLGTLEVYRFKTSTWEDENGNLIKSSVYHDESHHKEVLKNVLLDKNFKDTSDLGLSNQLWLRAALLSHVQTSSAAHEAVAKVYTKRVKPQPRYGHAACSINGSFVIYGGKLASGKLSSELWLFNFTTSEWTLRAAQSRISPPKLTRHTLTFVDSNQQVYLFGGAMENGEFSSRFVC